MKKTQKVFSHIINFVTIFLIIECFLCVFMLVKKHAREDCFDRIEETTTQLAQNLKDAIDENQKKLTVFADILAASSSNTDELLLTYMENFCQTQYFSALCIHRADGTNIFLGKMSMFLNLESDMP